MATPERTADVLGELYGTCKALHEVLTDDEQDDRTLLEAIDSELFLCVGCHWWYELDEMAEGTEDECENCKADNT